MVRWVEYWRIFWFVDRLNNWSINCTSPTNTFKAKRLSFHDERRPSLTRPGEYSHGISLYIWIKTIPHSMASCNVWHFFFHLLQLEVIYRFIFCLLTAWEFHSDLLSICCLFTSSWNRFITDCSLSFVSDLSLNSTWLWTRQRSSVDKLKKKFRTNIKVDLSIWLVLIFRRTKRTLFTLKAVHIVVLYSWLKRTEILLRFHREMERNKDSLFDISNWDVLLCNHISVVRIFNHSPKIVLCLNNSCYHILNSSGIHFPTNVNSNIPVRLEGTKIIICLCDD